MFLLGLPGAAQAGPFDAPVAPALAGALPPGFTESTVWSNLGEPTALRFAPDGRVFVASKSGIINVFDSVDDPTPTQFADLRTRVHDYLGPRAAGPGARPRLHVRAAVRLRAVRLRQGAELARSSRAGATPAPRRPGRPTTAA